MGDFVHWKLESSQCVGTIQRHCSYSSKLRNDDWLLLAQKRMEQPKNLRAYTEEEWFNKVLTVSYLLGHLAAANLTVRWYFQTSHLVSLQRMGLKLA